MASSSAVIAGYLDRLIFESMPVRQPTREHAFIQQITAEQSAAVGLALKLHVATSAVMQARYLAGRLPPQAASACFGT